MNQLEAFGRIDTFLFDVDGVFTDSGLLITPEGQLLRRMSTRDGYAVKRAASLGYRLAVITGGNCPGTVMRLKSLGIHDVFSGVSDKVAVFQEYIQHNSLDAGSILFLGDDLPDYGVMRQVGMACCPSDAVPEIKAISHYISPFGGGQGCVRDVIEKVLRIRGQWSPDAEPLQLED